MITRLDRYSPQGPEEDLTEEMELHCGAIKALQIDRRPSSQGGGLSGTAEVVFYTKADAMTCLEASRQRQLYIHGTPISAEQIEQNTEKPMAPHGTRHSSAQDNLSANTGERALRTSDEKDKHIEARQTAIREHKDKRQAKQYRGLISKIYGGLNHYSPDGPENDLTAMLEEAFGKVLSVFMERMTTPAGPCLLGTAEVAFATQKAAQKCIKASEGKYLFLFGRHLHAKMV